MGDAVSELSALDVVDELEDLVSSARRVPLSASVIVNEDETLELVDRLRVAMPEELLQARQTLEDRERILGTAQQEAEQTLSRAEHEAERLVREATERAAALVAESAVTQQAHAHAAEVVRAAEEQAAATRSEADAYARDVMMRLEEQLVRAVATVRKGIEALPAEAGHRRGRRQNRKD